METDDSVEECVQSKAVFSSKSLALDLRYSVEDAGGVGIPSIDFGVLDLRQQGHLGLSVYSEFVLKEGQIVTFIMRTPPKNHVGSSLGKPTKEQSEQAGVPLDGELTRKL